MWLNKSRVDKTRLTKHEMDWPITLKEMISHEWLNNLANESFNSVNSSIKLDRRGERLTYWLIQILTNTADIFCSKAQVSLVADLFTDMDVNDVPVNVVNFYRYHRFVSFRITWSIEFNQRIEHWAYIIFSWDQYLISDLQIHRYKQHMAQWHNFDTRRFHVLSIKSREMLRVLKSLPWKNTFIPQLKACNFPVF